jgi:DMSO/TMAO reductase YedYZ molybdopterin-dependent catalytic subunit
MNGRPLPRGHGHPVRALIPGHWGEINVKWLTEIEVLEEEADGYWERRGWHGTGPVNTVAKLHSVSKTDGGVRVGGHAYAGTRGIDRVEVSTDGGDTWNEARLSEPLPGAVDAATGESLRETAEDAWRMWEYTYDAAGAHEVVVRAVDGTGTLQTEEEQSAFPRGATGWVSQRVDPRKL